MFKVEENWIAHSFNKEPLLIFVLPLAHKKKAQIYPWTTYLIGSAGDHDIPQ